ncbi:MAG: IS1/IS1595 family N-terminal zinc-binding domain-containing protein [Longimicrobiaceae bacterium]
MEDSHELVDSSLPALPEWGVVRNGHKGARQRFLCRTCHKSFGLTHGTPLYGSRTPADEIARTLLIVMHRGEYLHLLLHERHAPLEHGDRLVGALRLTHAGERLHHGLESEAGGETHHRSQDGQTEQHGEDDVGNVDGQDRHRSLQCRK